MRPAWPVGQPTARRRAPTVSRDLRRAPALPPPLPGTHAHTRTCTHTYTRVATRATVRGRCCRCPRLRVRPWRRSSGHRAEEPEADRLGESLGGRSRALTAGPLASRLHLAFCRFPGKDAHPTGTLVQTLALQGRQPAPPPRKQGWGALLYLLLLRCGFGVLMWAGESGRRSFWEEVPSWGPVGAHGRCPAGSSREQWDMWPGAGWEGGGSGGLSPWNDLVSVGPL